MVATKSKSAKAKKASAEDAKKFAILFLPGILARPGEQVEPIQATLRKYGTLHTVSYNTKRWDLDETVNTSTAWVRRQLSQNRTVMIFGVSVGGLVAVEIMKSLWPEEHKSVRLVLVDTPFGADTLLPLPKAARWVFTKKILFGIKPLYWILSGRYNIGNHILNRMAVPPKPENIEVPSGADPEAHKQKVMARAKQNLHGHSWNVWGAQLAYMVSWKPCLSELQDVDATYLACISDKNDTIAHPLAYKRWMEALPSIEVIGIETAHAAFLEASPTWNEQLNFHFTAASQ